MRAFLLLPLLLLSGPISAAESRAVTCRFLSFGADAGGVSAIATSEGGAEIACPLPAGSLSERIPCSAMDGKIAFLSSADKKPMAAASIPAGVNAAILVFVKSPAKPGAAAAWNVMTIPDTKEKFPLGGAFVANFHSAQARFIIGEQKGMLNPGGSNGYAMPEKRDDFNMAPVVFELRQGDKWINASESKLRFLPQMRYLIFAYTDPASGRPRIATVRDTDPVPPANPRK